jgi:hypothetical protein
MCVLTQSGPANETDRGQWVMFMMSQQSCQSMMTKFFGTVVVCDGDAENENAGAFKEYLDDSDGTGTE